MVEKIKVTLLEKVLGWLTGQEAFKFIKQIVNTLMDEKLTGEEKRQIAFKEIKSVLQESSTVLINLAIEGAVYIIKQQLKGAKNEGR